MRECLFFLLSLPHFPHICVSCVLLLPSPAADDDALLAHTPHKCSECVILVSLFHRRRIAILVCRVHTAKPTYIKRRVEYVCVRSSLVNCVYWFCVRDSAKERGCVRKLLQFVYTQQQKISSIFLIFFRHILFYVTSIALRILKKSQLSRLISFIY